ncbi:MAG: hypothetical protein OHK0039_15200 [Bacteroidia bacterium]
MEENCGQLLDDRDIQSLLAGIREQHGIEQHDLHIYVKGHWVFERFLLPVLDYQFQQLRNRFLTEADPAETRNLFGHTPAEASAKIKGIAEARYIDSVYTRVHPINNIFDDLQRHTW